jgi:UDP-N-acetylmuramyl pentapeptide phosphotransferase/UDP-N-acetylglucosamine-1-phosphate transferase
MSNDDVTRVLVLLMAIFAVAALYMIGFEDDRIKIVEYITLVLSRLTVLMVLAVACFNIYLLIVGV